MDRSPACGVVDGHTKACLEGRPNLNWREDGPGPYTQITLEPVVKTMEELELALVHAGRRDLAGFAAHQASQLEFLSSNERRVLMFTHKWACKRCGGECVFPNPARPEYLFSAESEKHLENPEQAAKVRKFFEDNVVCEPCAAAGAKGLMRVKDGQLVLLNTHPKAAEADGCFNTVEELSDAQCALLGLRPPSRYSPGHEEV